MYYETILQTDDAHESSLEGYVCDREDENWRYFLEKCGHGKHFIQQVEQVFQKKGISRVAVFSSLYVEEEYRNQGIGTALMEDAINAASDCLADVILLESDIGSDNRFDLTKWYEENFDFERLDFQSDNYPILVCYL